MHSPSVHVPGSGLLESGRRHILRLIQLPRAPSHGRRQNAGPLIGCTQWHTRAMMAGICHDSVIVFDWEPVPRGVLVLDHNNTTARPSPPRFSWLPWRTTVLASRLRTTADGTVRLRPSLKANAGSYKPIHRPILAARIVTRRLERAPTTAVVIWLSCSTPQMSMPAIF